MTSDGSSWFCSVLFLLYAILLPRTTTLAQDGEDNVNSSVSTST
jgi:hypothetical protein